MRNISLVIGKVDYMGEFYFIAIVTLDIIIYKEIGQLLLRYKFKYSKKEDKDLKSIQ